MSLAPITSQKKIKAELLNSCAIWLDTQQAWPSSPGTEQNTLLLQTKGSTPTPALPFKGLCPNKNQLSASLSKAEWSLQGGVCFLFPTKKSSNPFFAEVLEMESSSQGGLAVGA